MGSLPLQLHIEPGVQIWTREIHEMLVENFIQKSLKPEEELCRDDQSVPPAGAAGVGWGACYIVYQGCNGRGSPISLHLYHHGLL